MRVWEVHVSYKSSVPIPPPLSWWITSSCVEGEGKAAGEKTLLFNLWESVACDLSAGGNVFQRAEPLCQMELRNNTRVTHCNGGVMSGNVLSRDRSLSEDVHRPKLFKLRFASYILFTPESDLSLLSARTRARGKEEVSQWSWETEEDGGGCMINHVRSTRGWESSAIDHLCYVIAAHLMRKSRQTRGGDSRLSL